MDRTDAEIGLLIRAERLRRGWSMNKASRLGGCSTPMWSAVEKGGRVGPTVHRAVMDAFGWPAGWESEDVELLSPEAVSVVSDLVDRVDRIEQSTVITAAVHPDGRAAYFTGRLSDEARLAMESGGYVVEVHDFPDIVLTRLSDLEEMVERLQEQVVAAIRQEPPVAAGASAQRPRGKSGER